jgi:hypothetical protein
MSDWTSERVPSSIVGDGASTIQARPALSLVHSALASCTQLHVQPVLSVMGSGSCSSDRIQRLRNAWLLLMLAADAGC